MENCCLERLWRHNGFNRGIQCSWISPSSPLGVPHIPLGPKGQAAITVELPKLQVVRNTLQQSAFGAKAPPGTYKPLPAPKQHPYGLHPRACCLFEASLYSCRRVPVACISNEQLSVAPASVAEAYLIRLSSCHPSCQLPGNRSLIWNHTQSKQKVGSQRSEFPASPDLAVVVPGFLSSYVALYNGGRAILGIKTANCRLTSWPSRSVTGLQRMLVGLACGGGFGPMPCEVAHLHPGFHKAVNLGLFHVGHWVLGKRNLVEFSVK